MPDQIENEVGLTKQSVRQNLRKLEEIKIIERVSEKIRDPKAIYCFRKG